jgi:enediyne biosynthesis protein E4
MNPCRAIGRSGPLVVAALAGALATGCHPSPTSATTSAPLPPLVAAEPAPDVRGPVFTDVTAGSGLAFTYRNGEEADLYTILESLGGGVALLDYDRDGLLDVFVTGGGHFAGADRHAIRGHPNRLFKNLGGWKFRDVTAEAGLPTDGPFYSHGVAVGDYDNDGWPDLLVTGYGRLALYHNDRGHFVDVTAAAGLADPGPLHWSTSAAFADLDGDGFPDLFVAHYVDWSFANHPACESTDGRADVCHPRRFKPLPAALYRSRGGKGFALQTGPEIQSGPGLGVLLADLDGDGRVDVYVANDAAESFLYRNRGGGRFEEVGTTAGVAYDEGGRPNGSMGVDAADCDGSGRPSLFVANFEGEDNALYLNLGGGQFRPVSRAAGLATRGRQFVGFGAGFVDFDRDGVPDLFVANGHVLRRPASGKRRQEPALLKNRRTLGDPPGQVRFADVSAAGGDYFRSPHLGRGVAFGDLDNDGRIDLVVSHLNEPVALLRNTAEPARGWVGVSLEGKAPRDPAGVRLTFTQGGTTQVRAVNGGGSYLSSSDPRVVFAAGPGAYRLTVRWPSGREQTWDDAALGRDHYAVLREGEDAVHPYPAR